MVGIDKRLHEVTGEIDIRFCCKFILKCQILQSIRIIDPNNRVDIKYEMFKRIPSLKVIYHAKHDLMTRGSFFSISNYVRIIGIPYSKLGKLQEIVEKYSDDECDFGIIPM